MSAMSALAQTNGVVDPAATAGGISVNASLLQLLVTPVTLVLVFAIRKYFVKIPSEWIPFVAPFLGAAISAASAQLGLWASNGIAVDATAGAALGGLSTWVHQMGKQSGVIPESSTSDVVQKP